MFPMEGDIRDIKGLVPVPMPWWVWALVATAVVALAAGIWWWRRRKPAPVINPATPPPTPFEIALAALAKLRSANLPVEDFYTELSDIVRQFIEGRYGLRAPERTTEEFLAEAQLPAHQMDLLRAFLVECDLVKFARHQPALADRERAFAAVEKFVRESAG